MLINCPFYAEYVLLYQLQEGSFNNPDKASLTPFLSPAALGGLPRAVVGRPHFIGPSEAHCHLSHSSQSSRLWPTPVRLFAGIPYPLQRVLPGPPPPTMHTFFKWDHAG